MRDYRDPAQVLAWQMAGLDDLTLELAGHRLPPVTAGVFPAEPLPPGAQHDTAVGFDVAATSSGAAPALRWTHDGTVTVVPVGGAPELD